MTGLQTYFYSCEALASPSRARGLQLLYEFTRGRQIITSSLVFCQTLTHYTPQGALDKGGQGGRKVADGAAKKDTIKGPTDARCWKNFSRSDSSH